MCLCMNDCALRIPDISVPPFVLIYPGRTGPVAC